MNTIEIIAWILAAISVIGVVLNIYKVRACFMLWIFTNGFWTCYDLYKGVYPQAALFFVYFCLAIFGVLKWGKKEEQQIKYDAVGKPDILRSFLLPGDKGYKMMGRVARMDSPTNVTNPFDKNNNE